jgi:hypothetical protein
LVDQFGIGRARVLAPLDLCVPARKNSERLVNRTDALRCYAIAQRGFRVQKVAIRNQFGPARLDVVGPSRLCAPARVDVGRNPRAAAQVDHFKCYSVRGPAAKGRSVKVSDRFGSAQVKVLLPALLCAPAQKNAEISRHPVRHLLCYFVQAAKPFKRRSVREFDQFGVAVVDVLRRQWMCVPTVKVRR